MTKLDMETIIEITKIKTNDKDKIDFLLRQLEYYVDLIERYKEIILKTK